MHKKLAADLTNLAHSILQMKNKEDVFALKQKAHQVYEKLAVLAYVEEYINQTPNPKKTKEELITEIEAAEENEFNKEEVTRTEKTEQFVKKENVVLSDKPEPNLFEESTSKTEEQVEYFADETPEKTVQESKKDTAAETTSLEDELEDAIAVDVAADMFEEAPKKSLNESLQPNIQIGLNDRIAFVKNLFGGSQEDFNRVVSQLNTFKTEKEAKRFVSKMVKPDYDWTNKEELEERFIQIIERKFA